MVPLTELDHQWALRRPVAVDHDEVLAGTERELPPDRTYFYPRRATMAAERTHVAALNGVGVVQAEDPSLVNRQPLHQSRRSRRIQIALGLPHPGIAKSQLLIGRRDLPGPLRIQVGEAVTGKQQGRRSEPRGLGWPLPGRAPRRGDG
ncbi:hypothetical protein [Streptomyces sp. NPDC102437]|uniref:hypothetical protein n=1 Tax=Streptomyces sp. NPDC102437 TaxID=3366175 RepID=UPI00382A3DCB